MTKQNKILLGLGIVGLGAYYYFKKKRNFTNFSQTDLDACMAANPTSAPEKCCIEVGGNMVNGVCTNPVADTQSADCIANGGTWNGTTCTPCAGTVVNGVCVSDEQLRCESTQGGIWDSATNTCKCARGVMVNGVCSDAVTLPPEETPPPASGSTTTIVTPPPYFPGLSNLPTSDGSAASGGGGGSEDKNDLFDWIPWILAGMTTALSVVSEQKQQA
jgi:hypothetical protein